MYGRWHGILNESDNTTKEFDGSIKQQAVQFFYPSSLPGVYRNILATWSDAPGIDNLEGAYNIQSISTN